MGCKKLTRGTESGGNMGLGGCQGTAGARKVRSTGCPQLQIRGPAIPLLFAFYSLLNLLFLGEWVL